MAPKSNAVGANADSPEEEKAETSSERKLTPLGQRTLAGFKKKFGEEDGEDRFNKSIASGMLDKSKHMMATGKEKNMPMKMTEGMMK